MKKFLIIFLSILLSASALIFVVAPIALKEFGYSNVADLNLNTSEAKLIYDLNEQFSSEGLVVEKVYTSGRKSIITDYKIDSSAFVSTTEGVYEIVVIVEKNAQETYLVEVIDKGQLSFVGSNLFYVNQPIEETNLSLKYTATDGEVKEIDDFKVISFDNSSVGLSKIYVEYNSFQYELDANIITEKDYLANIVDLMNASAEDYVVNTCSVTPFSDDMYALLSQQGNEIYNYVRTQGGRIAETWASSETYNGITKVSYVGSNNPPSISAFDFAQEELFTVQQTYAMMVLEANRIINNSEQDKDVLIRLSTNDGSILADVTVVDKRTSASVGSYMLELNIATGNIISFCIEGEGMFVFDVEIDVPNKPDLPTAETKGNLVALKPNKFVVGHNYDSEYVLDLNLGLSLNGQTYPINAEDYKIEGFDSSTVGTKTLTITYNTFTYNIDVEIVSKADYVKYLYNLVMENDKLQAAYNVYNLILEQNNNLTGVMVYDKYYDTLYVLDYTSSDISELWIETDGTVTKESPSGIVTKTKYDTQELALKGAFAFLAEDIKLSEFISYIVKYSAKLNLSTIIPTLTDDEVSSIYADNNSADIYIDGWRIIIDLEWMSITDLDDRTLGNSLEISSGYYGDQFICPDTVPEIPSATN